LQNFILQRALLKKQLLGQRLCPQFRADRAKPQLFSGFYRPEIKSPLKKRKMEEANDVVCAAALKRDQEQHPQLQPPLFPQLQSQFPQPPLFPHPQSQFPQPQLFPHPQHQEQSVDAAAMGAAARTTGAAMLLTA
jgi:hypothetical protein